MRSFFIICMMVLFSFPAFAQQFQLEATIDKHIDEIFDIDGDGICEYVADTNKVYDGLTHNLKYIIPAGFRLHWGDAETAQNPNYNFPNIDFNSDGKRDLVLQSSYSIGGNIEEIVVYDVVNNIVLFEFNPPEETVYFDDLIDIDGDGDLELILAAGTYSPTVTIDKTYIFSTGVATSALEHTYTTPPSKYQLKQNFPNPFNPSTTIRYSLSGPENISIRIYDVSGQLVKEINKEHNQAGEYEVIWDGSNNNGEKISSGIYFYRLSVGNYNEAKKMILIK
jgi:hypothetical protein